MPLKLIRIAPIAADTAEPTAEPPREMLDPARLLMIRYRLETGFYQRDEVLERLAQRVAPDLA